MGLFATGVTVVAAEADGDVRGMTANAVMSVSLDPLLVCVSIDRRAAINTVVERVGGFSLNILREEQEALSPYFAGLWKHPTPPEHRFQPWVGGPRLVGCLAAAGCRVHAILDGGDHRLFLGRVLALHQGEGPLSPLLFFGGRYHRLREPALAPRDPEEVWIPEDVRIFYGD
ncbi:MAG: flavin reductase family protein [Armatimonadetes bacterium]|nr:flavin reductase family protein [Armatimonadota bacterium]